MSSPSLTVRRELEQLLNEDTSRVGDVYRRPSMNAQEIAADLGVDTANFVSNNRTIIKALLDGALPDGPAIQRSVASKVRSIRRQRGLSADTTEYLDGLLEAMSGTGPAASRAEPTRRRPAANAVTLRAQVEEEVRRRMKELVDRIRAESDVQALDYRSVVASERPLDAVVRVIRWRGDDGTFDDLVALGRRDLTLEQAVESWADDLPLTADLVDEAAARIDWTT